MAVDKTKLKHIEYLTSSDWENEVAAGTADPNVLYAMPRFDGIKGWRWISGESVWYGDYFCYGNGKLLLCGISMGPNNMVHYSIDGGHTWTFESMNITFNGSPWDGDLILTQVIFANGRFLATRQLPSMEWFDGVFQHVITVFTSIDAINWERKVIAAAGEFWDIWLGETQPCVHNGEFMCLGSDGRVGGINVDTLEWRVVKSTYAETWYGFGYRLRSVGGFLVQVGENPWHAIPSAGSHGIVIINTVTGESERVLEHLPGAPGVTDIAYGRGLWVVSVLNSPEPGGNRPTFMATKDIRVWDGGFIQLPILTEQQFEVPMISVITTRVLFDSGKFVFVNNTPWGSMELGVDREVEWGLQTSGYGTHPDNFEQTLLIRSEQPPDVAYRAFRVHDMISLGDRLLVRDFSNAGIWESY